MLFPCLFLLFSVILRFGTVYKVPTLSISYEQVSEEVRTRILKAERKVTKKRVLVAIAKVRKKGIPKTLLSYSDWDGSGHGTFVAGLVALGAVLTFFFLVGHVLGAVLTAFFL